MGVSSVNSVNRLSVNKRNTESGLVPDIDKISGTDWLSESTKLRVVLSSPFTVNSRVKPSTGNTGFVFWGDGNAIAVTDSGFASNAYSDADTYVYSLECSSVDCQSGNVSDSRTTAFVEWGAMNVFSARKMSALTSIPEFPLSPTWSTFWGANIFEGCTVFNDSNISNYTSLPVPANISQAFKDCTSFNQDVSALDVSGVTNMSFLFRSCRDFQNGGVSGVNQGLDTWDTSSVVTFESVFRAVGIQGAVWYSGQVPYVGSWDTTSATNMSSAFAFSTAGRNGAIGVNNWDMNGVTTIEGMFAQCEFFNEPLDQWDTSTITDMSRLFGTSISAGPYALSFNQDISSWDVSSVTTMENMFADARAFNCGNIAGGVGVGMDTWDVSSVTNMDYTFGARGSFGVLNGMQFNQYVGSWNVSSVTSMVGTFRTTINFNADITGWNISSVTITAAMFEGALSFNQDISGWASNNVTNTNFMFSEATSFNQNMGGWNISSLTQCARMFENTAMSDANISATLAGWDGQASVPSNVSASDLFGTKSISESAFPAGKTAYDNLVARGWTITGLTWTA